MERIKITVEREFAEATNTFSTEHRSDVGFGDGALSELLAGPFADEGSQVDSTVLAALGHLSACGCPFAYPAMKAMAAAWHYASDSGSGFEWSVTVTIDVKKLFGDQEPSAYQLSELRELAELDGVEVVNMPDHDRASP